MAHASRSASLSDKPPARRFVTHGTADQLKGHSIFAREDLVMFEPKLGRRMSWIAWRFAGRRVITESSLQRTNRTRLSVVTQQSAANRAGPFACRNHGANRPSEAMSTSQSV